MSLPTHQAQAQQGRSPSSSKQVRLPPTDRMPASSIIGDGITQYRKRKRERACDLCRRKKIRCDYDHTCPDRACSSCSGYGKMCTFLEAARKRGPSKLYVKGLEDRLRRMEELLMSATGKVGQLSPEQMKELGKLSSEPPEDDDKDAPARPICRESLPVDDTVRSDTAVADIAEKENPGIQRWELLADDQQRTFSSSLRGDARYFYMGSSSGVHLINKLLQDDGGASSRYGPNKTSGGEEEDMMVPRFRDDNVSMKITCGYQSMEKWEVPPQEIVDRLVELYFMKMNIYFPIVDKAEFYESYQKGGDALCTPLLLAICRSACRLLDADDWVVKKFNINRNQLFVDITNELERKFVVDFLNPNIEYIQVFLITALSARRWTPESTDWLGVSIAVKMAQDLGLHRSDTRLGMSIKRREARKRLWWSAYVMDRWICAALRRPLAISDADCDVELPSVDSEDDRFSFLVHMTKLSAILGDILRVLCSPRARNLGDRRPGVDQVRQSLERNLQEWEAGLPHHLKLSPMDLDRIKKKDLSLELEVRLNTGVGQLHLAYQSLILLLKRPSISKVIEMQVLDLRKECIELTEMIVSIIETIHVKSLLTFSWSLTSSIMTQALTTVLFGLRSPNKTIVSYSRHVLEGLKNQYRRLESYVPEPSVIPLLDLVAQLAENDNEQNLTSSSPSTIDDRLPTRDDRLPAIDTPTATSVNISRADMAIESSAQRADEHQRLPAEVSSQSSWQELMMLFLEKGFYF